MPQHSDPDDLAMLALGEQVPDEVARHVAACAECAAERDAFAAVLTTARAAEHDAPLVAPDDAVWGRIESELGLGAVVEGADADAAEPADPAEGATVTSLSARRDRSRVWPWMAAAAAVGVVAGGVGTGWVMSRTPADQPPTIVAQAPLEALPNWDGATGAASVTVAADGSRTLELDVEGSVPEDGFREVWLIDREVTRLVSIGVLEGSKGTFVIPAGIDLDDFAVVDVSQENLDGDPAHSGDSIVRGVLET